MHADADKQGLVQGMITGMRGLCNGLGPAMFGLIFSLFHIELNENKAATTSGTIPSSPHNSRMIFLEFQTSINADYNNVLKIYVSLILVPSVLPSNVTITDEAPGDGQINLMSDIVPGNLNKYCS